MRCGGPGPRGRGPEVAVSFHPTGGSRASSEHFYRLIVIAILVCESPDLDLNSVTAVAPKVAS